jgi:hypothetical protein
MSCSKLIENGLEKKLLFGLLILSPIYGIFLEIIIVVIVIVIVIADVSELTTFVIGATFLAKAAFEIIGTGLFKKKQKHIAFKVK